MQHSTRARSEEPFGETSWEDIDFELSGSTREVCLGYGSWERARTVIQAARAHGSARPSMASAFKRR